MNKSELLKNSLMKFYSKPKNLEVLASVLLKKTKYSLTLCEWLCINYSKKYNVNYKLAKNKHFNIYLSYKEQLASYQKKQFDLFKRKHSGYDIFKVHYNDTFIETTVGQLNFFKWAISNKILEYLEENLESIKNDMEIYRKNTSNKEEHPGRTVKLTSSENTTVSFD
jgi:hypothetical protein